MKLLDHEIFLVKFSGHNSHFKIQFISLKAFLSHAHTLLALEKICISSFRCIRKLCFYPSTMYTEKQGEGDAHAEGKYYLALSC